MNEQEREAFEAWLQSQGLYGPSGKFGVAAFEGWQARAALATKAVPAGYKLVLVEPTEDMLFAAEMSKPRGYRDLWAAMLAATPPAPAPEATPAMVPAFRTSLAYDVGFKDGQKATPAPAPQPLTDEQTQEINIQTGASLALIRLVENYILGNGIGASTKESGK